MELDKQIFGGISDNDLETEILESQEIQAEISSTMAWVECLMQDFKCLPALFACRHLHNRSVDHHYLQTPDQGLC